jgi:hypothetical protein
MKRVLFLLAGLVAALISGGSVARAQQPEVEQQVPARPQPAFTWSVPDRFAESWKAYDAQANTYDIHYIYPKFWPITVDACGSTGGLYPIQGYRVEVQGIGNPYRRVIEGSACTVEFPNIKELGSYRVSVSVQTRLGWSAPATQGITRRDWVIVSLGDSLASGEGVPDEPGVYELSASQTGFIYSLGDLEGSLEVRTIRAAKWKDKQCHRSARGGHALAAAELERRDPHSSVTFVSLACSGAELKHLYGVYDPANRRYTGMNEPNDEGKYFSGVEPTPTERNATGRDALRPQIDALKLLLGTNVSYREQGGDPAGRRIDVLMLSAGVNDLGFSDIVKSCAANWNVLDDSSACVYKDDSKAHDVDQLPKRFAHVADRLAGEFDLGEVYIAGYPANPFRGGGCGVLGVSGKGITDGEAEAIRELGIRLNGAIKRATERHGWNYVDGMTEKFEKRPYCASDPLFNKFEQSYPMQGTRHATAHPNRQGHAAYRDFLLDAIVLKDKFTPYKRVTLVIEQVKFGVGQQDGAGHLEVYTDGPEVFGTSRRGVWVSLPASQFTFHWDVYKSPAPPQYDTEISFRAVGYLFDRPEDLPPKAISETPAEDEAGRRKAGGFVLRFGKNVNYGAGPHEEVTLNGQFAIRYRIVVEDITCAPVTTPGGSAGMTTNVPRPTTPAQGAVDCQRTQ